MLEYLSAQLTAEFGKGFSVANLRNMRQFYCMFPIRYTLCNELSWSHYRLLMRIPDEKIRMFYAEECAKSAWSVRQLERQIHTMYYQRILASQDKAAVAAEIQKYVNYYTRELMNEGDTPPIGIILCADKSDSIVKYTLPENNNQVFASKYFTYLPTEEELKRELRLGEFHRVEEDERYDNV